MSTVKKVIMSGRTNFCVRRRPHFPYRQPDLDTKQIPTTCKWGIMIAPLPVRLASLISLSPTRSRMHTETYRVPGRRSGVLKKASHVHSCPA